MPDRVRVVWKEGDLLRQDGTRIARRRGGWLRYEGVEYPLCTAAMYYRKGYWYLRWYREEYEEVDTIGGDLGWKFDYLREVKENVKRAVLLNLWKVLKTAKEDGCGRPY